ncbi:MAG: type II toxin-antitoxin system HicB family antitoxin [Actinobacteria bacterium]|nr:type II toxin-antitoxin system HicB family antitoxin [Actinomycetota bacterium]
MVRINISIDEKDLKELDRLSSSANLTRSGFIRKAMELYKSELEKYKLEEKRKKELKEAIKIQEELSKLSEDWDGVSEIRKWRESR